MLPQILWLVLHVLAIAAAPVKDAPLAKLKIRKLPTRREGENVHEAFQRHYTQALRRHAHLTGRAPPTHEMLIESMRKREDHLLRAGHIKKRLWFAETDPTTPSPASRSVDKRLWFPDTAANATGAGSVLLAGSDHAELGQGLHAGSRGGDDDFGGFGGLGGNGGGGKGGGGGNGGTGKASAVSTAAAASITVSESGSNANGFSQTDLDLLENDTLTKSTSDLVSGGLGFIIEGADTSYVADIQMGTPPQSFVMIMDTGSSDTWVPDSACTDCGNHLSLGADTSSSFQGSNSAFQVTYGSGAVAGTLCQDTMTIAGMTLDNHTFGTVTQESSQFSSGLSDGLMGLAFSSLSEQQTDTPVDSLVSAGLIKQGILGVALGRVDDGENIGELVFGQADTSKFDASTTQTLDVTSTDGFWQTAMAAVQVNGQAVVANRQAIHDTGTTLIVAPSADATAFHAQIQGAQSAGDGTFTIPCTTNAAVFMQFGDAAFQIDPRDLIFEPVSNDLQGDCISGIMAGTVTDDQTWLLGDVMLKNVYMTTNVQDRTVSFSARTDVPGSSAASAAKNNAVAAADGSSSSTGRKIKVTTKTSLGGLAAAVGALAARWRM